MKERTIDLIQILIKTGHIQFKGPSQFGGIVDVFVKTDIFTDAEFSLSIDEDTWSGGPIRAVASSIVDALENGSLNLLPELLDEEH